METGRSAWPQRREDYTEINSLTWDHWADDGVEWTLPISAEEFAAAKEDRWEVFLTPTVPVPRQWFFPFPGNRILGLASGGGQQMPVFTALGAHCTVFDNSERQLASEQMVAKRERYEIETVKGDMTKRLPFDDQSFGLIFHPVSNCYIEEIEPLWQECFRVLRPGGLLLAGFDNGLNYLVEDETKEPPVLVNRLPFNPLRNASDTEFWHMAHEDEGIQFSHSLEEQIGGQLRAGFRLLDLYEDRDREGGSVLRKYVPQYMATRSLKEK